MIRLNCFGNSLTLLFSSPASNGLMLLLNEWTLSDYLGEVRTLRRRIGRLSIVNIIQSLPKTTIY